MTRTHTIAMLVERPLDACAAHRSVMTSPEGNVIAWITPARSPPVRPVSRVPFSPQSWGLQTLPTAGAAGAWRARVDDVARPEVTTTNTNSAVFMNRRCPCACVMCKTCLQPKRAKHGSRIRSHRPRWSFSRCQCARIISKRCQQTQRAKHGSCVNSHRLRWSISRLSRVARTNSPRSTLSVGAAWQDAPVAHTLALLPEIRMTRAPLTAA